MARTREIVLEAARKLLVEEGPDAVTALRVSDATGIARTTIYRHWPDRTDLLRDAVASDEAEPDIELSGEIRADLIVMLTFMAERLARRRGSRMMAVAIERAGLRGEAGGPHREMVRRRMDPLRTIIQASMDSGDISNKLHIDDAVAELAGPPFFQGVLLRRKVTDEFIARVVDGFLAAHPSDA